MTRIKDPENVKQGAKLKMFLKEIGMRGNALAAEMGIEHTSLSRYIIGYSKTPQEVIDYLYKKHNLNLDWWYTGKGTKKKNAALPKELVFDIAMLSDKLQILELRINEQDKLIKKLILDLYDEIKKRDTKGTQ